MNALFVKKEPLTGKLSNLKHENTEEVDMLKLKLKQADAEFQSDKPNQYGAEINPLINDDPLPCDGCPFVNECKISGKECVAFRGWSENGKSVGQELRGKNLR